VWVANQLDGTISRIDPGTPAVTKTVSVRGSTAPFGIAVGEGAVWVAGSLQGEATLTEIDPGSGRFRRAYNLGKWDPVGVAVGSENLWITANGLESNALLRVDPSSGKVITAVALPTQLGSLSAGDDAVWVASAPVTSAGKAGSVIWRVDPSTNEIVATVKMTDVVALALDAGTLWIARGYSGPVAAVRLDTATNAVVATVSIGSVGASQTQIIGVGDGAVWLGALGQGTVSRIDPATNTVVATIDLRPGESADTVATFLGPNSLAAGEEGVWTGIFG
jgi:virginiamycin B lyase